MPPGLYSGCIISVSASHCLSQIFKKWDAFPIKRNQGSVDIQLQNGKVNSHDLLGNVYSAYITIVPLIILHLSNKNKLVA